MTTQEIIRTVEEIQREEALMPYIIAGEITHAKARSLASHPTACADWWEERRQTLKFNT